MSKSQAPEKKEKQATPATLRECQERLALMGVVLRQVDEEYQVKYRDDPWDGPKTYFTTDLDDAFGTGQDYANRAEGDDK